MASYWSGNPFSGMDGTVVKHCRLSRTIGAPKMDTKEVTFFEGCSRTRPIGLFWKGSLQIAPPFDVLCRCKVSECLAWLPTDDAYITIRMIAVEPCIVT